MSTVTPNFNWPVPTSTDLVKDGATAIEALGDSIDASLVDLKGGTTGQVLSKTSNTDMDFTWVAADDTNAIQNTIVDAKGDLIAATAADTPARLAVGTDGQVLTADSTTATGLKWATASAGSTNVAGKNVILNSALNVWQRGTSIALTTSAYTADRWQGYRAVAGSTVSRQATGDTTNLPFIQYCARVQRDSGNTATNTIYFGQSIETINSIPLAGKTVTLSFYARAGANYSSASSALSVALATGTGTDQNYVTVGYTGVVTAINTTATLTTTWQRFTYTATLATTATEVGLQLSNIPVGTAGAADYYEVTGVQLEIASSASAYSPNTSTYASELVACQRYFVRAIDGSSNQAIAGQATGSTSAQCQFRMPVEMRTSPTLTVSSASAFFMIGSTGGVAGYTSAISAGVQTTKAVRIDVTASGLTAGDATQLQEAGGSPWIALSAEL